MFDVVIKNGTVIDGTGKARFQADLGVEGNRITAVEDIGKAEAKTTLDATDKIVCPGFVDPHSHAELAMFREDHHTLLEPLIRQGITTFVGGNCGMSLAPLQEKNLAAIGTYINIFSRIDIERDLPWRTSGEFFNTLETRGLAMNMAPLAPHGLLRMNETGRQMRYATEDEIENMARALEQCLEEGAIGLSTGLQYVPGSQSDSRELHRLGQVLKKYDGIFTSHLRSYSNTLPQAMDEVIEVADKSGIRAQISHIFWVPDMGWIGPLARGAVRVMAKLSKWWTPPIPLHKPIQERIEQMLDAQKRGVNVSMDIMPTTSGFTHIFAFFPPWSVEGTSEEVLARLQDPDMRKKIRHGIEHGKTEWPHVEGDSWSLNLFKIMGWECAHIMAVGSEKNKKYEGRQLVEIAAEQGKHPFDAACDLILEENGHVLVFESMAEPDDHFTERSMFAGLKHPDVMISTDAILMGEGHPSKLFYGCYPIFLGRFVRDMKLINLEQAIRKCTSLPAEHFRLKGRGKIEKNAYADIVVFDPNTLHSNACFTKPNQFPQGIEHVFINGNHVVNQGTYCPNPRPGRILKRNTS
ncbi:MAG TPA: amidohydrolase family protein [Candidatus Hydrogenedentes bacterium]|nr:amidohydrolase family protein [Candidatus Hydrogenedentota bacterium]